MRAIAIALLLAACAPTVYHRPPGATSEQFERQIARCRMNAAMIPPPAPSNDPGDALFHTAIVGKTIENCMRAEGYIKQ
jgi:hypothetical protein